MYLISFVFFIASIMCMLVGFGGCSLDEDVGDVVLGVGIIMFIIFIFASPDPEILTHQQELEKAVKNMEVWEEVCRIENESNITLSNDTIKEIRNKSGI